MISIIGFVLWEGVVLLIARQALEAIKNNPGANTFSQLFVMLVVFGLFVLPFTGVL
jgi:hypothetical protein